MLLREADVAKKPRWPKRGRNASEPKQILSGLIWAV
jgi:hypothetical protein